MFKVTFEWISRHATAAGGYSAAQLRVIGVRWPPKQGWKQRAVGRLITEAERELFESYSAGPSVTQGSGSQWACACSSPPWEDCEHTDAMAEAELRKMLRMA
jgi:hypothetical protein